VTLGLLLAPGAGADRNQATLVALDRVATASGLVAERMDFPYRIAGRKAPDRPAVLVEAVVSAAKELAGRCDRMVLGGRSMGGRMCSVAVAEGLPAAGLVLISYPLHPPGQPTKLRTEHFARLEVPCLFVSGTRDAFGSPSELERAAAAILGPVEHRWIEGKDHGLRGVDDQVGSAVMDWMRSVIGL
jgi:predicted alpha/beta-hydrolase family hydrolase